MQIKNRDGALLCEVPDDSLRGADLRGADLRGADLRGIDLRVADLSRANLRWADFRGADLRGADLSEADLSLADFRGADLRGAVLHSADLHASDMSTADLRGADLSRAELLGADLSNADLSEARLRDANLYLAEIEGTILQPPIVPLEGEFIGYKKVLSSPHGTYDVITLRIPADAQRTSALASRKCRASHVEVVEGEGEGVSPTCDNKLTYTPGATVRAGIFNPDRREECTYGIHFFMTREEAEEYQP